MMRNITDSYNAMIRRASVEDVPTMMEIFANARGIMRASGNHYQWSDAYPSQEIILRDIEDGVSYLLCSESGEIIATMAFIPGPDPTYAEIYDREWQDDKEYHVIHRIAVTRPGLNAAKTLLDWAFSQCRTIRIDTHRDNVIMHHLLKKYGFSYCGVILLANGDPRDAYSMSIG